MYLTDAVIQSAIRRARACNRSATLADGSGRGVGRLTLRIRPMPSRIVSEWYAQQWLDGRRSMAKIGAYPAMTLAEARERFGRDYSVAIAKGSSIKIAVEARPGTVADLIAGYVSSLHARGAKSADEIEKYLRNFTEAVGAHRKAREIATDDVLDFLRPIYRRGSISMADHYRAWIRAAFAWGLRSESDYRLNQPRRFKLAMNPAESIPTEPRKAGERWLTIDEFVTLYDWLGRAKVQSSRHALDAIRLLMLLGQRPVEIVRLKRNQWDSRERILTWEETKNGRPHVIPVPDAAAAILDRLARSGGEFLFPSGIAPGEPMSAKSLHGVMRRVRDRMPVQDWVNRDLRRTWKTLAGYAGLSKEARDLLQNHARHDVSAKHYDRYDGLKEKRAAMALWSEWIEARLNSPRPSFFQKSEVHQVRASRS